jgi:hypothetical protein
MFPVLHLASWDMLVLLCFCKGRRVPHLFPSFSFFLHHESIQELLHREASGCIGQSPGCHISRSSVNPFGPVKGTISNDRDAGMGILLVVMGRGWTLSTPKGGPRTAQTVVLRLRDIETMGQ